MSVFIWSSQSGDGYDRDDYMETRFFLHAAQQGDFIDEATVAR